MFDLSFNLIVSQSMFIETFTMSQTFLSIILSVSGALIMILLGIVGFFLKRYIKSTDSLTKVVTSLETVIQVTLVEQKAFQAKCDIHTQTTTKRLDAHANRLDDHQTRLSVIESQK